MPSDLQTALDVSNRQSARAMKQGIDRANIVMAQHLRWEHRFGIRRIARRLGVSERRIKEYIENVT